MDECGEDEETGRWNADQERGYGATFEWPDGDAHLGPWYAVSGDDCPSPDSHSWTISPDPRLPGWCTDNGTHGYGLPRDVAEMLVLRLNLTCGALHEVPGGLLVSARFT